MACGNQNICLDRKIFAGDEGTLFRLFVCNCDVPLPLKDNLSLEMIFERPDKTSFLREAVLSSDGLDGGMQYIAVQGDLNQVGQWRVHGRVTLSTGRWYTDIAKFKTHEPIPYIAPDILKNHGSIKRTHSVV